MMTGQDFDDDRVNSSKFRSVRRVSHLRYLIFSFSVLRGA